MRDRGLTLTEALVIIILVGAVILFLVGLVILAVWRPDLNRRREEARIANCKENLMQIGKSMEVYRQNFNEYSPFCWGPANGPGGPEIASTQAWATAPGATTLMATMCDPGTSLGCLYPAYIPTVRIFKCPSTEDQPSFVVNTPQGVLSPTAQPYLWSQHNWTLTSNLPVSSAVATTRACSYGYDPRISPHSVPNMAIMGDWDGSWQVNHDTADQNHDGGQHVLYVDGSVEWRKDNYASNDPIDNIYMEGGIAKDGSRVFWNADTDSFLVDCATALTLSYDGYPMLQK